MSEVATEVLRSSVPADMMARVLVDVGGMLRYGEDFSKWKAGFNTVLPLKVQVPIFDTPLDMDMAYMDVAMGKVYHHDVGVTIHGENTEIAGQYILAHILPEQPEDASWLRLWVKDW